MFKTTREKYNYTQEQMGKILEVTQDMVSLMERRKRFPGFDTLLNYYKEFGIENLDQELKEEISARKTETD